MPNCIQFAKRLNIFAGLTKTFIGTKISINCVHFMCIDLVYCNVYYVLYTSTTSHNTVAFQAVKSIILNGEQTATSINCSNGEKSLKRPVAYSQSVFKIFKKRWRIPDNSLSHYAVLSATLVGTIFDGDDLLYIILFGIYSRDIIL